MEGEAGREGGGERGGEKEVGWMRERETEGEGGGNWGDWERAVDPVSVEHAGYVKTRSVAVFTHASVCVCVILGACARSLLPCKCVLRGTAPYVTEGTC